MSSSTLYIKKVNGRDPRTTTPKTYDHTSVRTGHSVIFSECVSESRGGPINASCHRDRHHCVHHGPLDKDQFTENPNVGQVPEN